MAVDVSFVCPWRRHVDPYGCYPFLAACHYLVRFIDGWQRVNQYSVGHRFAVIGA